jgi:acylphosphatase
MRKALAIIVSGVVQGVFFRVNVRQKARELGLSGWVRNEPDGTVKILAEGEEDNLKKIIAWCYNGAEGARVDRLDAKWGRAAGEFTEFQIRGGVKPCSC